MSLGRPKRSPSLRIFATRLPSPTIVFWFVCLVLAALVLVPEAFGSGKGKDYDLWYWAGQRVLDGASLYPEESLGYLRFIYPPFAAVLLALPSYWGKLTLYILLTVLNCVAWWIASRLSNAMTGSTETVSPWLAAIPSVATFAFIYEQYSLGQPNLVLLAVVLCGFWLLQRDRSVMAGAAFAFAASVKVFPILVLPYLLWRRRWAAALSTMLFVAAFTFVVPGSLRGFERNAAELATWSRAMAGGADGFGQRVEQNWSFVNQSVIAVTHRWLRPISYDIDEPAAHVNVASLDRQSADLAAAAVAMAIGLGFILVMPARSRRTTKSDAEEIGILLCLVTIASPLTRNYYFVWLLFPLTVLIHRAALDPRPLARRVTLAVMVIAGLVMSLSLPAFPRIFQAVGFGFFATLLIAAGLAWHLRHPAEANVNEAVAARNAVEPDDCEPSLAGGGGIDDRAVAAR